MKNMYARSARLLAGLVAALSGFALAGCVVGPPPDAVPPPQQMGAAPPGYGAPPRGYGAPSPGYGAPPSGYGAPPSGYGAPPSGYGAPPSGYGAPSPGYGAPRSGYAAPGPAAMAAPMPAAGWTRAQYIERFRQVALNRGRDPEQAAAFAARRFDMIDTNRNGVIDPGELQAFRAAHGGMMAQGPGQPSPGGPPGAMPPQGGAPDQWQPPPAR
jgi:hypothetical protein